MPSADILLMFASTHSYCTGLFNPDFFFIVNFIINY